MYDSSPAVAELIDREYFDINYKPQQSPGRISLQECLSIVREIGASIQGIQIVLDALNESQDAHNAFDLIKELIRDVPSCRIMLSSTEEFDGTSIDEGVHIVQMSPKSIDLDVQRYIETSLKNNPFLAKLPDPLKERIRTVLQRNHDGMYVSSTHSGLFTHEFQGSDGYNVSLST